MTPRPSPLPAIRTPHKSGARWTVATAAGTVLLIVAARLHAESLADLLRAVATNAHFDVATRADIRVTCTPACQTERVLLLGRGDAVYVETRNGQRALLRPDAAFLGQQGHATPARMDVPLGDTVILLRDLAVFSPASLALPQISDDGPDDVVVTSAPAGPAPYVLLVHTIDRERRTIVKTQYYTDSIGQLTKIRRDGEFTRVADHWRPTTVTVERFDPSRTTRLSLAWGDAPDVAATLFEPAGLEAPSTVRWAD